MENYKSEYQHRKEMIRERILRLNVFNAPGKLFKCLLHDKTCNRKISLLKFTESSIGDVDRNL